MKIISKLFKAFRLYLAGLLSVIGMYYLLIGVEQGIDVVIQAGEYWGPGLFATLAVPLWAGLIWYTCRVISYIKQNKENELFEKRSPDDQRSDELYYEHAIPWQIYQHVPRWLAYNCFVAIQVAIFNLPTFWDLSGWLMISIIAAHNALYFGLSIVWTKPNDKIKPVKYRSLIAPIAFVAIAAYVTFNVVYIFLKGEGLSWQITGNHPLRHTFWLSVIALAMFVMQVLMVRIFIQRRELVDQRRTKTGLVTSRFLQWLKFNINYNAAERPFFNWMNVFVAFTGSIYLSAIFSMYMADQIGPLAFALLAFGILTALSNFISVFSIRWSFNVFVVLFVIAFLLGKIEDPYAVRLLETKKQAIFHNRPTPQQFLDKWFADKWERKQDNPIYKGKKYPVYLVLSNGGASRAGKWTTAVLSHLQDTSYAINPNDTFNDHVLSIAGASGGTVGNCAFYSLLKAYEDKKLEPKEKLFSQHSDDFFSSDFLTFTLARLLGPDMMRHLFPIPMDDRAAALENVLSNSGDPTLNKYFQTQVDSVFDTSGKLPILYITTTQVDNGMPGVISSIKLSEGSQRNDVLSLVDRMGQEEGNGNLRLSTAAILSSRFPYVSPAGKVFDRYYVDGGYFDNSGAGTVLELIRELKLFLSDTAKNKKYQDAFSFHILHITNSERLPTPAGDIHPLTNDLLAPVLTLAGMQGSSTNISDRVLVNTFEDLNNGKSDLLIEYSLYDEDWNTSEHEDKYEEGYPMSWVISDYQLHRMKTALQRANKKLHDQFYFYFDKNEYMTKNKP